MRLQSLCPACQAVNPPTNKFCSECGQRLAVAAAAPAPAPAAAPPATEAAPPATAAPTAPPDRFASPEAYTPKHLAEKILTSRGAMEGERKGVTVMFSDVSGFTAMSEKLDPEEVHAIMDRAFGVILNVVHRYEGTINQFLGDGVMALFGAPIAHEDHAHRALGAALAIQQELQPLADDVRRMHGVEFRMRMGINTGLVVVGAIGRDLRMDYTAVGDTTNLAARLLGVAKPGQVVVSRRTQHLRDGFFVFEDLGEFQVKGKTEPVRAYALISEVRGRTRLEVSALRGFTRLVGREAEMEILPHALARAAAGSGQVVALVGDAGLGKSRMVWEFTHSDHARDWLVLEARSVSYGKAMTYLPVVDLLKAYCQIEDRDEPAGVRAKVRSRLMSLDPALETAIVPVLAILHVPFEDQHWMALDPPQRRHRMLDGVKRLLIRQSELHSLLLVFEDLHWIDSETQALLDGLVDSLESARVLLLVNYRPEYRHGWDPKPYYTGVRIEPLAQQGAEEFLGALLGDDPTLIALKRLLIERTAGNPLFLEESVRSLVETETLVGERGAHRLAKPLTSVQVPATVQSLLAARIDRLSPELKDLLQSAAVIGKDVPLALLRAVADLADQDLRLGLGGLQAAELLFETSLVPEPAYSFKHAMTHDVAYASLLQGRRRMVHSRIVEAIEQLYANRLTEHVERLAHHAYRGQVWDKAVTYLRQAGAKAQGRSAHQQALACLEEALEALRHQPETPARQEQEIDLHLALRGSLYPLGEFPTMVAHLREAEALARALADARRLGLVSIYTGEYFRQAGRFVEARQLAEQALALGDKLQDLPLQLIASEYLALACHALGDYRRAAELLRAATRSRPDELRPDAFESAAVGSWSGHQVMSLAWLARCLAECGEFGEGLAAGQQAVAIAEGLDSQYGLAAACIGLGYISLVRGDLDTAGPLLERARSVAGQANITLLRPQATRLLGGVYLLAGRIDEGLALVRAAAEEVESRRLLMQQAAVLVLLGQACLAADRLDEAAAVAQRVLALARERSQRGDEAAALRLLGEIAERTPGETETAVRHYQAAIALTGELGMRPLLARSHLGLGRLWLGIGERGRAEDELLAATRLFCEMDMGLWVHQTMATLSQLGRLLIVAADRRDLYEYLHRTLGDQWISVVLDRTERVPAAAEGDDGRNRDRIDAMLRSRGLSIA